MIVDNNFQRGYSGVNNSNQESADIDINHKQIALFSNGSINQSGRQKGIDPSSQIKSLLLQSSSAGQEGMLNYPVLDSAEEPRTTNEGRSTTSHQGVPGAMFK